MTFFQYICKCPCSLQGYPWKLSEPSLAQSQGCLGCHKDISDGYRDVRDELQISITDKIHKNFTKKIKQFVFSVTSLLTHRICGGYHKDITDIMQVLPTLVSNPNFSPLATGLSVNLMACRLHFPACRLIKQACL